MSKIHYRTNDYTLHLFDEWWEEQFGSAAPAGMNVGYVDFTWQLIDRGRGSAIRFLPSNFKNEYNLCLTPLNQKGRKSAHSQYLVHLSKIKTTAGCSAAVY